MHHLGLVMSNSSSGTGKEAFFSKLTITSQDNSVIVIILWHVLCYKLKVYNQKVRQSSCKWLIVFCLEI